MEQNVGGRGERLRTSLSKAKENQQRNLLYTVILMVFGLLALIIGIIMVIANGMQFAGLSGAIFTIGLVLFLGGYLWKSHDEKQVELKKEELESWRDTSEQIEGIRRV